MSTDTDTETTGDGSTANVLVRTLRRVVPDLIRRRFALKFALVLIIMGVMLAAIGFTATNALSTQVEDDTRAEYEQRASQQATIVEKWIQRNTMSVRLASQNQGLQAPREQYTQSSYALTQIQSSLVGDVRSVHLVSAQADRLEVISNTQTAGMDPTPVSDTSVSWIADRDITGIGPEDVLMSNGYSKEDTPVIGYLSPVPGSSNRYLVIEYRLSEVATSLGTQGNESHFSMVVNTEGAIQADTRMTDGSGAALQTYANTDTIGRVQPESSGVRIIENNPQVMNEPYAVGYASIDPGTASNLESRWVLVTHAPTSDLFGFVRTVSLWGQIVTLAGAVLIGIVGATMGYSTASAIDRLREKVEEMEEGNLDVEIQSGRIDSIGRLYGGFASMRDALRTQINEAEQARKEAEVARAEAMEMSEYLQEKAKEYSQIMGRCASGDLTQRMDVDGENDAMDQIATDFNEMIGELEKTTGQLKHFADEVEEAGDVVETSAESVRDASEQVAESIQHISDDAHDQQERLEELSAAIDDAIEQFEAVAVKADVDVQQSVDELRSVADAINDLAELTDGMMAEAENVAGAAEEQAAELNSVSQQARDLTRYARPLRDVLESFETEEEHEFYFPTGPGSPQLDDE